ncbi:MAG: hypothetical protein JO108_32810 [Acidobacteriaceae bacterium]|nr:hypothetical protein [Acidobacteriaceae bacterium]
MKIASIGAGAKNKEMKDEVLVATVDRGSPDGMHLDLCNSATPRFFRSFGRRERRRLSSVIQVRFCRHQGAAAPLAGISGQRDPFPPARKKKARIAAKNRFANANG